MSSEDLLFTIDLHGKDFLLRTGVPSHRLEEEVVKRITKCKGEYSPTEKGFIIPAGELCNLLDECFDYFTEESLVAIATLLEKSEVDQSTKERVREKSVSKSKVSKKKKEDVKVLEPIREERREERRKDVEKKEAEHDERRVREEERRKEVDRRNRELEERLAEIERQREEDRRNAIREEDRRNALRKASPIRFRAPELGVKKNVNFESGSSRSMYHSVLNSRSSRPNELKDEVMSMMSHLRTSMSEMKENMSRLEHLIARKF